MQKGYHEHERERTNTDAARCSSSVASTCGPSAGDTLLYVLTAYLCRVRFQLKG